MMQILAYFLYTGLIMFPVRGTENSKHPTTQQPATISESVTGLMMQHDHHKRMQIGLWSVDKGERDELNRIDNPHAVNIKNGMLTTIASSQSVVKLSSANLHRKISETVQRTENKEGLARLFEAKLNKGAVSDLDLNGAGRFTTGGLRVDQPGKIVRLNRFYALAERKVRYRVQFDTDAKVVFQSSEGDFKAYVDLNAREISLAGSIAEVQAANFLVAGKDYEVEIWHIYQESGLRISDPLSGEQAVVRAVQDGQGGAGKGVLQTGRSVGMQWDYYCFGLVEGSGMLVMELGVYALKKEVQLLIYGDSISQPEAYFPTSDFPRAWTQQVISKLRGRAMSSGRGGAQIDMVANYIRNELPYIKARYVMVTIGTNGGNTEDKLKALMQYIRSKGAIPILNNIPCNESGTQVKENQLIEKVRQDLKVSGCRFDLATSLKTDGKEVDRSLMYWEDYSGSYGWQIYHHPNEKGGDRMFKQTLKDLPEIYR